ncbi:MAG: signal peptidase II [Spirochaetaceae bacterium]|jgi:signal peptidase II|nr:signal peptidase II [Spirochaetaceae bacterium]
MGLLRERLKYILATLAVFFGNYMADRITKELAIFFLKDQQPIGFFNNALILVYVENSGAFLSMGQNWPPLIKNIVLLIAPIAICIIVLLVLMLRTKSWFYIITIATIVGGGMGNLVDRLANNFAVVDFLNFGIGSLRTGVLNVADLSVTAGVVALFIYELQKGVVKK